MRWDDVLHQDAAMSRLERALRGGRLPHAYVFVGPEGVGKRMAAARLARRLLCANSPGLDGPDARPTRWPPDACGRCDECVAVEAGTHVDLHLIHRALNRFHPDSRVRKLLATELGVDVVRTFVTDIAAHHPARGRSKVFIFEEAERINAEAQNALLKTLEEPPGTAFFFLLTVSAERLLPTTRSRCQTMTFARLPDAFVRERLLRDAALPDAAADYLVGLAEGRAGAALRYAGAGLHDIGRGLPDLFTRCAEEPLAFSRAVQELLKTLEATHVVTEEQAGSAGSLHRAIQALALAMLACVLRDALRMASGHAPAAYRDPPASLRELAERLGRQGASRAIRALAAAESDLERSVNAGLVFDGLGIEISRAQRRLAIQ